MIPKENNSARVLFALDATASREATWDVASQLQDEMFSAAHELGGIDIQFCYFRGFGEFFASEWHGDGLELRAQMGEIRCAAGATQIHRVFTHAIKENKKQKLKALIFVGDAMEENLDLLAELAGKLGLLNTPVFMFQEGTNSLVQSAFRDLARLSGGAYSSFDLGSANEIRMLLAAVAVYAAGGLKALADHCSGASGSLKLLEQQLGK